MTDEIHPKTRRTAIMLLILLIIIGGIILYRDEAPSTTNKTVPQIAGPTAPPPHSIEIPNEPIR